MSYENVGEFALFPPHQGHREDQGFIPEWQVFTADPDDGAPEELVATFAKETDARWFCLNPPPPIVDDLTLRGEGLSLRVGYTDETHEVVFDFGEKVKMFLLDPEHAEQFARLVLMQASEARLSLARAAAKGPKGIHRPPSA